MLKPQRIRWLVTMHIPKRSGTVGAQPRGGMGSEQSGISTQTQFQSMHLSLWQGPSTAAATCLAEAEGLEV